MRSRSTGRGLVAIEQRLAGCWLLGAQGRVALHSKPYTAIQVERDGGPSSIFPPVFLHHLVPPHPQHESPTSPSIRYAPNAHGVTHKSGCTFTRVNLRASEMRASVRSSVGASIQPLAAPTPPVLDAAVVTPFAAPPPPGPPYVSLERIAPLPLLAGREVQASAAPRNAELGGHAALP
jgi:hypothetical protein